MLSPIPGHLGKLQGGANGTSGIAENGLLLMVDDVLGAAKAAVLMQYKAH